MTTPTPERAKALDAVRGVLPAASLSNVGIYGSGQSYEAMLIRMRSHPLPEARHYADLMLEELRKVIPSFLKRVDLADRGGRWSDYLSDTRESTSELVGGLFAETPVDHSPPVVLTDFDPEGEDKLLAAIAEQPEPGHMTAPNSDIIKCDWDTSRYDPNRKWLQILNNPLYTHLDKWNNEVGYSSYGITEIWFQQSHHKTHNHPRKGPT